MKGFVARASARFVAALSRWLRRLVGLLGRNAVAKPSAIEAAIAQLARQYPDAPRAWLEIAAGAAERGPSGADAVGTDMGTIEAPSQLAGSPFDHKAVAASPQQPSPARSRTPALALVDIEPLALSGGRWQPARRPDARQAADVIAKLAAQSADRSLPDAYPPAPAPRTPPLQHDPGLMRRRGTIWEHSAPAKSAEFAAATAATAKAGQAARANLSAALMHKVAALQGLIGVKENEDRPPAGAVGSNLAQQPAWNDSREIAAAPPRMKPGPSRTALQTWGEQVPGEQEPGAQVPGEQALNPPSRSAPPTEWREAPRGDPWPRLPERRPDVAETPVGDSGAFDSRRYARLARWQERL